MNNNNISKSTRKRKKIKDSNQNTEGEENDINYNNLTISDVVCPICLSIMIEPVSMPCKHSLCMSCFQSNVAETALACPLCRKRISIWVRKNRNRNSLINTELWEWIQQTFKEKVEARLQGLEDPEDCLIGLTPAKVSAPGEIRKEYEAELQQIRHEQQILREKEEKESEKTIMALQEEEQNALEKLEKERKEICEVDLEVAKQLRESQIKENLALITKKSNELSPITSDKGSKLGPMDHFIGRSFSSSSMQNDDILYSTPRTDSQLCKRNDLSIVETPKTNLRLNIIFDTPSPSTNSESSRIESCRDVISIIESQKYQSSRFESPVNYISDTDASKEERRNFGKENLLKNGNCNRRKEVDWLMIDKKESNWLPDVKKESNWLQDVKKESNWLNDVKKESNWLQDVKKESNWLNDVNKESNWLNDVKKDSNWLMDDSQDSGEFYGFPDNNETFEELDSSNGRTALRLSSSSSFLNSQNSLILNHSIKAELNESDNVVLNDSIPQETLLSICAGDDSILSQSAMAELIEQQKMFERKIQQEKQDRLLALQLEREMNKVDRSKGSSDGYSLRNTRTSHNSSSLDIKSEIVAAKSEDVPVKSENVAVKSENVPVKSENVPVKYENVPVKYENVPVKSEDITANSECHAIKSEFPTIKFPPLQSDEQTIINPQVTTVIKSEYPLIKSENVNVKSEDSIIKSENVSVKSKGLILKSEPDSLRYEAKKRRPSNSSLRQTTLIESLSKKNKKL